MASTTGEFRDSAAVGLDGVWAGLAGELGSTPAVDLGIVGGGYRYIGGLTGASVIVVGVVRGWCRAAGKFAGAIVVILGVAGLDFRGVRGLVGNIAGVVSSARVVAVGTGTGSLPTFLVAIVVWAGSAGTGKLVPACLRVGKVG